MSTTTTISESDILDELVCPDEPSLSIEAAKSLLDLKFSDRAQQKMRELLDLNNRGELTEEQTYELEAYRRVGLLVDLLQAKARAQLKTAG